MIGESLLNDILGIIVGHVYYFLTDVYPKLPLSVGTKILDPPPSILYFKIF